MDNFNLSEFGYNKKEVNDFVEYVIKKTEDNILTIKNQNEEISKLQEELSYYKKYSSTIDSFSNQNRELALKEANLIVQEAKDNANKIVNDALLKARKIEIEKEALNKSIKLYKKKIRNTLIEQLEMIEDIEIL